MVTVNTRPKILVIDDEYEIRSVLCDLLKIQYDVVEAENGEKGLEQLQAGHRIDLILSDISMPHLTGIQFLERYLAQERHSHAPVIMVTAHTELSYALEALRLGAVDYVEKPFDAPILLQRVKKVLEIGQKEAFKRFVLESTDPGMVKSLDKIDRTQRLLRISNHFSAKPKVAA